MRSWLPFWQAVRSAEQETMINCFQNVIYKMGRADDVRQWRVRDWIDWFGKASSPHTQDLRSAGKASWVPLPCKHTCDER